MTHWGVLQVRPGEVLLVRARDGHSMPAPLATWRAFCRFVAEQTPDMVKPPRRDQCR
ncbi:MAG: hypothetical protein ACRD2F_00135 [Terriglobales bacterium]